jgi:Reverse transcriptase (RNA-dependent DNA polymerase)
LNYHEAITNPNWCKAIKEELKATEQNKTWVIVKLPNGKKLVGCKWVYKIKYKSDGTVERYKARLIVKRYTQTYGIDYYEIFAPVIKINIVQILFSIAIKHE